MKEIIFLIPAFNEEKNLKKVILQFQKKGKILVVDDGSVDNTKNIAKKYADYYLKNNYNKGYDYSLQRGLKFISRRLKSHKFVITIDGDGQHQYAEVSRILLGLKNHDVVIGNRNLFNRSIENKISIMSKLKFNIKDPLSGMKGYRIEMLEKNLSKIKKNFNYYGMFFFEWIDYLRIKNVRVSVNKKNKKSSMGESKLIEEKFFTNFKKILKKYK